MARDLLYLAAALRRILRRTKTNVKIPLHKQGAYNSSKGIISRAMKNLNSGECASHLLRREHV